MHLCAFSTFYKDRMMPFENINISELDSLPTKHMERSHKIMWNINSRKIVILTKEKKILKIFKGQSPRFQKLCIYLEYLKRTARIML